MRRGHSGWFLTGARICACSKTVSIKIVEFWTAWITLLCFGCTRPWLTWSISPSFLNGFPKKCDNPKGQPERPFPLSRAFSFSCFSFHVITFSDLNSGHLGETLSLIFALSHYKQQQKSLNNLVSASPQHVPRFVQETARVGHAQVLKPSGGIAGSQKLSKMSATKWVSSFFGHAHSN